MARATKLFVGLALVAVSLGVAQYFNPPRPPFHGRYAFFKQALSEYFGAFGPSILWFALAVVLLVAARFVWRHSPKLPPQE
jgi:hypothetical protein